MSRYELAELEADMREMMEAGDQDEDMTPAEIEAQKKNPMYHKMLKKLKQL